MLFEARIWKGDSKWWLAELPIADVVTQGRSRKDAMEMLEDLIKVALNRPAYKVHVRDVGKSRYVVEVSDPAPLVALILKRQRSKHRLSLADAAKALGQSSRNSFARYEQGRAAPTIDKLVELLHAVAPEMPIVIGACQIAKR